MAPRGHELLLLTRARDLERAVVEAAGAVQGRIAPCRDLAELEQQLAERSPVVALVDLDCPSLGTLARLEPLAARFPRTRFVVLCSELSSDVLIEAMQAGARHCLAKASTASDLPGVLRRLLQDAAPPAPQGRVVTVLSASGGSGATTLAINLAEELRREGAGPVLLVDLDAHYGAVAGFLDLSARFGVADLLAQAGAIDGELLTSTAVAHADGLSLLLGPASVDFAHPRPIDWNRLEELLDACRQAFPLTVVDAARVPLPVAAQLALASVQALMVFELAVTDIRGARALLSALAGRQVPDGRVLPVANRWQKRHPMVSLADAQQALGGADVARVSNDFEGALRAINYGRPIAHVAPRSPLRADLAELARRLMSPATAENAPARRSA